MYEDSQRFSDEEGEESGHVVSFHPRSMMSNAVGQIGNRVDETERYNPSMHMMRHDVDEDASSLLLGMDEEVDTPEFNLIS